MSGARTTALVIMCSMCRHVDALDWVRGFACTSEPFDRLDAAAAARALGRLREMPAARLSGDAARSGSGAWIVTASRR